MSDTAYKSEKLASAVYVITGFFNNEEPLKWRLRSLATSLAPYGPKLFNDALGDSHRSRIEAGEIATEIITLLRVAKNAGLISPANHELLEQEFGKFVNSFGQVTSISDFFAIESQRESLENKRQISEPRRDVQQLAPAPAVKDTRESNPQSERKLPTEVKNDDQVSNKKNTRQNTIVELLKTRKEVMIKDVAPLITGCSEKTIQRELLAMVKSGVLKKEGEKRWSRYSLA
jgi:hypothetical protein